MTGRSNGAPLLAARSVSKDFDGLPVLTSCDLEVRAGERVALMGASGAGKSTLLHCLAGVVAPDGGEVSFDGDVLSSMGDEGRSDLRLQRMGLVFQSGDLVPDLTLVENVMLPLVLTGERQRSARRRALDMLDRLGVARVADRRAAAVSGGQAQRAAVARAIVHRPAVLLADEPTGPLDAVNAESVLDVLTELSAEHGTSLVVVTHDNQVASHLDRLVTLRNGTLIEHPSSSAPGNSQRTPADPKGTTGPRRAGLVERWTFSLHTTSPEPTNEDRPKFEP